MKRTLISLLLVAILASGAAFGLAHWLRCKTCTAPPVNLRKALNLSESQQAEYAKLEAEYQKRLDAICAAHCAARAALADALDDRAKAAECCARMCAAQSESEKLTLDHLFKVRALLTPEQQKRHADLVRQQLAGACPMRLHQP
jgi:Spy/CpxP family protein refolding chaperone